MSVLLFVSDYVCPFPSFRPLSVDDADTAVSLAKFQRNGHSCLPAGIAPWSLLFPRMCTLTEGEGQGRGEASLGNHDPVAEQQRPGARCPVSAFSRSTQPGLHDLSGAENSQASVVCVWQALSRSDALLSNQPSDYVLFKAACALWASCKPLFGKC